MKLAKFLMAILVVIPFLSACQSDIEDTGDPRDAITRLWRVTDDYDAFGANGYDVTISKDAKEQTQILFLNFGGWDTQDNLYATLSGSQITIPSQTLDATYTVSGNGTITGNNFEKITFTYSVTTPDATVPKVTSYYGVPVVTKKKKAQVKIELQ